MAFKVRQSKFRHLFGELPRETYNDIKCSRKATEGAGIEGNEKRLALPWDAARQVLVLENSKHGRVEHSAPKLNNTAPVLDFKFSPFSAEQLTTGGEDGTVRVFEIPEDGLTKTEDPSAELTGHLKPVVCLDYHPCVEGLLATASKDQTVRIWDLEEQNEMAKFDMPEEVTNVQSLQWRYDGSLLGLACKDKISRIFDPRQASAVLEIKVTESTRPTKFCWAGQDRFISTGFSTNMDREFFLWDIRNPAKFLHEQKVDKASGALMPWYDAPHGLLFLAAKGDGNVRYYEITNDDKVHYITDNRSTKSIKAFNFVSRRALDTTVCETHRALKLEGTLVQPISFRVPRKSTEFQEDLFPDMVLQNLVIYENIHLTPSFTFQDAKMYLNHSVSLITFCKLQNSFQTSQLWKSRIGARDRTLLPNSSTLSIFTFQTILMH